MDTLRKRIAVVGSINTDMVVKSSHIPRPGETVLGGSFMMNSGGKGANQARAAVSYALGQGAPMIAAVWGIFVWKEFAGASRTVKLLLGCMFLLFIVGLGAIIISGAN